jgi:hypothetical protein
MSDSKTVEPLVVSPKTAMQLLDCSSETLWKDLKSGVLTSFLEGTRRKILLASIKEKIARRVAAAEPIDGGEKMRRAAKNSVAVRRAKRAKAAETHLIPTP